MQWKFWEISHENFGGKIICTDISEICGIFQSVRFLLRLSRYVQIDSLRQSHLGMISHHVVMHFGRKFTEISQKNKQLSTFLEQARQDIRLRRLGLVDFLIMPMQRIWWIFCEFSAKLLDLNQTLLFFWIEQFCDRKTASIFTNFMYLSWYLVLFHDIYFIQNCRTIIVNSLQFLMLSNFRIKFIFFIKFLYKKINFWTVGTLFC